MKKIYLLSTLCLLLIPHFGQSQTPPNAFNYSAVARDVQGNPIANQTIGIQITILQNNTLGPIVYSENHFVGTDDFGLFNLVVGGGAIQSGAMATIPWSTDNFYMKVGMDSGGGTNFLTMGTTQLLSVPYALHAKTADILTGGGSEFSGDYNDLINAPTNVSTFINDAGYVTTDNDQQQLSVSDTGDTLYLSNGNWVIIPGISVANGNNGGTLSSWLNPDLDYGTVTDQVGNTYATIVIGTQEWMAENLKTTAYSNGDPIPNVTDGTQWSNLTTGAWVHYNNDSQYEIPYGKLYNWYTVVDTRNLCPIGWHVPTDAEWSVFINYLDPNSNGGNNLSNTAGRMMKSTGTQHWLSPNTDATNESGFSGLPGGNREPNASGFSYDLQREGHWWSSSEYSSDVSPFLVLSYNNGTVARYLSSVETGRSVRCVRD